MKIEVAGAGAGKTTSLAKKIIQKYNENMDGNIFCVSFTNSSVNTISSKLTKYFGTIPNNIKVSTIHSFLYSQFISPYYFLLYNQQYSNITDIKLDTDPKYKRANLSRYEKSNILHVDLFTQKAKFIVCEKTGDAKHIKKKREKILSIVANSFGAVYVDEAQDIDKNFSLILKKLDSIGVSVELIGDPKQDLNGTGKLKNMIKDFQDDLTYKVNSHRCPSQHLKISNLFVNENEKQKSTENKQGIINYFFESDIEDLASFIEKKSYDLKYIYQKTGQFQTEKVQKRSNLFEELKYILKRLSVEKGNAEFSDEEIIMTSSRICYELINMVKTNGMSCKQALSKFFPYGKLTSQEYLIILGTLENEINKEFLSGIRVDSINRVKGQEGEKCLFIVTKALMPYFLKEKKSDKMLSHVYVALTRSENQLDILFTSDVEANYSRKDICQFMDKVIK